MRGISQIRQKANKATRRNRLRSRKRDRSRATAPAAPDEAAFATLVRRYTPMVLGTCRRVLRNAHDAEDICQTTFLILVHKASGIRKRESLGGWLHRVAYRLARDLAAQRARRAAEPLSGAEIAGRVDQAAEPS